MILRTAPTVFCEGSTEGSRVGCGQRRFRQRQGARLSPRDLRDEPPGVAFRRQLKMPNLLRSCERSKAAWCSFRFVHIAFCIIFRKGILLDSFLTFVFWIYCCFCLIISSCFIVFLFLYCFHFSACWFPRFFAFSLCLSFSASLLFRFVSLLSCFFASLFSCFSVSLPLCSFTFLLLYLFASSAFVFFPYHSCFSAFPLESSCILSGFSVDFWLWCVCLQLLSLYRAGITIIVGTTGWYGEQSYQSLCLSDTPGAKSST